MFEKVKEYYEQGLWNEERVRMITIKGKLTWEEYEKIVQDKKYSI